MENRERDKTSKNNQSNPVDDVNRKTSSHTGKQTGDFTADLGRNTGSSKNLKEPNSRGENSGSSGYDSSSKGSTGNSRGVEPRGGDSRK